MLLYIFMLVALVLVWVIVVPVALAILMALDKLLLVIFTTFWKVILISFVVSLLIPVPLLWLYVLLLYLIIKFMEGE